MYFWIDEENGINKTYNDLIADINGKKSVSQYIYYTTPYDILVELITSLIYGLQVEILDGDLSSDELERLGIDENALSCKYSFVARKFENLDEVFAAIERNNMWRLVIYTSGTTGRPKKVEHTLQSLTRTVRIGNRHKSDVWGFSYNASHFAGLQVFFQAFFNRNSIVYLFECERGRVEQYINQYACTHISATPTFYRNLLPFLKQSIPSICHVTMGGEKFDHMLVEKIKELFPNAKIHNIYASTEAGSLFTGNGSCFEILDEIRPFLKISDKNELLLHKSLMGSYSIEDDWYNTQDIVEVIDDKYFCFISRESDMVNVGGYKVNLLEVEEEIKKVHGVLDAVVKGRVNNVLGNILVAEIKKDASMDEKEVEKCIFLTLGKILQKWKIPRVLNFVEEIDQTRSGKKVRRCNGL